MKKRSLFALIFTFFALYSFAQSYVYSIDDYGVDSFYLNETYNFAEGATVVSTIENRYFFSDTAQLTQFLNQMQTEQLNKFNEGTRLRNEAIALQVRIDSIELKRTFSGLSLMSEGFRIRDPLIISPDSKRDKPPDTKQPARKPKKKQAARKPKE